MPTAVSIELPVSTTLLPMAVQNEDITKSTAISSEKLRSSKFNKLINEKIFLKFRYIILNTRYNKENTGSQDTIKSTQDTGNIDTGFISKNNYFRCQDLNHKSLQYRCSSKHNCRKYPGIFCRKYPGIYCRKYPGNYCSTLQNSFKL